MKLLVFSDLHIGHYQEFDKDGSRLQRCLDALSFIFRTAIEEQVMAIVDCGDLIDRKNLIDFRVYNKIYNFFRDRKEMLRITPFWSLVGNHNIAGVDKETNLGPLSDFITIHNRPGIISGMAFLPFQKSLDDWYLDYHWLCEQISGYDKPHILFAHQEITGAVTGTHRYVAKEGLDISSLPGPFDYCVFGHYHQRQACAASNVFYCGAALQQDFGEEGNEQGFWIYDSDRGWEWRTIDSQQFKTVNHPSQINDRNFYRLRVPEVTVLPEEVQERVRVEIIPQVVEETRINMGESLDDAIDAYMAEKIPPEHHPAVRHIIGLVQQRRESDE